MKKHILSLLVLLAVPAVILAKTLVYEDTFENRTTGDRLHRSVSSDGKVKWVVSYADGDNRMDVTIEEVFGNKIVRSTIDNSPSNVFARDRYGNQINEPSFHLEIDYYYLQEFDDNLDFRVQYRLREDYNDLDNGGNIPGYRVRLKADNSKTSRDSIRWFLETDPNGPSQRPLASGSIDIPRLIVAGETTPGTPISLSLEVVDDRHKLTLNGTKVADIRNALHNDPAQGALNFKLIGGRNRGFDNVRLRSIRNPTSD